jgi:hypothetical protein
MVELSQKKQGLIKEALQKGVEISLNDLIEIMDLKKQGLILDQLQNIKEFLNDWDLEIYPSPNSGDIFTPRVIKLQNRPTISEELIYSEIQNHESSCLELKSSLLYDYEKAADKNPNILFEHLRSEDVLFSVLKTIAAFLNSGGGILYVGLDDDGNPKDLINDCKLLGCESFNSDKWQLNLRSHVTGKFKDGAVLNDYIEISFIKILGFDVARVQVLGRRKLVFLKQKGVYKLYRRQGNQTTEVLFEDIEEFFENRVIKI